MTLYICPLCSVTESHIVDNIQVHDLLRLYHKKYHLPAIIEYRDISEISFLECNNCKLKYFYPAFEGGAYFYNFFQQYRWYYQVDKQEFITVQKIIPRHGKVLDIGCGFGHFASYVDSTKYVGLELHEKAADYARNNGLQVVSQTIQEHAILHVGQYDVICAFQVLEHVSDPRTFIMSCYECLKPNGLLVLSVPNADSFVGDTINGCLNLPPHHLTWWSEECLKKLPEIFHLKPWALILEPLERVHFPRYCVNKAETVLFNLLGIKRRVINLSFQYKLLRLFALPLFLFYLISLLFNRGAAKGHSVTAIYQK